MAGLRSVLVPPPAPAGIRRLGDGLTKNLVLLVFDDRSHQVATCGNT